MPMTMPANPTLLPSSSGKRALAAFRINTSVPRMTAISPVRPIVRAVDAWSSDKADGACSGTPVNVSLDIDSPGLPYDPRLGRSFIPTQNHVRIQRFEILPPQIEPADGVTSFKDFPADRL